MVVWLPLRERVPPETLRAITAGRRLPEAAEREGYLVLPA
jgi:hypothetical protein